MILIAVDAHSKWPEAHLMTTTTTSKTIVILREMFARYGLPRQIVTDNGPQFISQEFQKFMGVNGIKHIRCSPFHPASNGAAERVVQTIKKALRTAHLAGDSMEHALATFLLRYRTTPHATTGVPPCTLMFGRDLRTRLHLVAPKVEEHVRDQQARQKTYHDKQSHTREFHIGQNVWARNLPEGPRWLQAREQRGPVSYLVQLPNGDYWRRHVDMLRAGWDPQPADESPEPDELSESSDTVDSTPPSSIELTAPTTGADTSGINASETLQDQASGGSRYPSRYRRPPDILYETLQN